MKTIKVLLVTIVVALFALPLSAQAPASPEMVQRVDAILHKMTLEEKIDYIGGTGFAVRAMPALKLPSLEMSDGPIGVRSNLKFPSTTYAAGIGLAATFDTDLAAKVGDGIGKDARARGVHFMLGPGMNIYRSPLNGRNFEYFGEDPFLAGQIAANYILGMQKNGVSATAKHFLANNSEYLRHDSDSVVDERTLREIYLPAFEASVKQGHVGALMDSYNFINGAHATQNGYFNTDVARHDWGFEGVMMSDWVATYDGVAAANNGLDLEMPVGSFMNRPNLLPAIKDGRVKESTIDEKVRRILLTAARFSWLDRPQRDESLSTYNEANRMVALQSARESITLLKNDGNVLPLDKSKLKTLLVVGPDAYPARVVGGGSGGVNPFSAVSPLEGIAQYLGPNVTVFYEPGLPTLAQVAGMTEFTTEPNGGKPGLNMEVYKNSKLEGTPASTSVTRRLNRKGFGWDELFGGNFDDFGAAIGAAQQAESRRFTGYYNAAESATYLFSVHGPMENCGYRLYVDGKLLMDNWDILKASEYSITLPLSAGPHKIVAEDYQTGMFGGRLRLAIVDERKLVSETLKRQAAKVDAVIIAAGYNDNNEGEGADRSFELPFGQDVLIRELAPLNKKTVLTVTAGGGVATAAWLDHVPAYLHLWYGGEQGGTALAEALFGDLNPSGHLPISVEKRAEDNPSAAWYYPTPGTNKVPYKDGIFVGYRGYEHNKVQPQFPFGFGLSYTTFKISNLKVTPAPQTGRPIMQHETPAAYIVSFDVTNTGKRAGADVAQVYVGENQPKVARPVKELKGFSRVELKAGETRRVEVTLNARAFTYYDVAGKQWHADAGKYTISVGDSSASIAQKAEVALEAMDVGVGQ